jgi:hypothetical protein
LRGCSQGDAARELAKRLDVSLCKTNRVAVDRSANVGVEPAIAAAKIHQWGDEGPPKWTDEVRRHSYSDSAGQIVKVKIKKQDGSYTSWYRVSGGWQAHAFGSEPVIASDLNCPAFAMVARDLLNERKRRKIRPFLMVARILHRQIVVQSLLLLFVPARRI